MCVNCYKRANGMPIGNRRAYTSKEALVLFDLQERHPELLGKGWWDCGIAEDMFSDPSDPMNQTCKGKRPDYISTTRVDLLIVIEIDENRHASQILTCEISKVQDIFGQLKIKHPGLPIVYIRLNCDSYRDPGTGEYYPIRQSNSVEFAMRVSKRSRSRTTNKSFRDLTRCCWRRWRTHSKRRVMSSTSWTTRNNTSTIRCNTTAMKC